MPELGQRLREARRRQGLDLSQVEASVKVRAKYLRALEWERFDLLPDTGTARRMLRAYAEALALDVASCVRELDAHIGSGERPAATGAGPKRKLVSGGVVLALIAASAAIIGVPLVLALEYSGSRHVASTTTPRAGSAGGAKSTHLRTGKLVGSIAARSVAAPAARRSARLEVVASRGDSWLAVRAGSEQGPLLFAGTLARGHKVDFRRARLWLSLGAASNVDVRVNGLPPHRQLYGTLNAVVTAAGFRQVPLHP